MCVCVRAHNTRISLCNLARQQRIVLGSFDVATTPESPRSGMVTIDIFATDGSQDPKTLGGKKRLSDAHVSHRNQKNKAPRHDAGGHVAR